jgi:hypothetical protein
MAKEPRVIHCHLCKANLSARTVIVNHFGHNTRSLRAPPRMSVIVGGNIKKHAMEVWYCKDCHDPVWDMLIERLP